MANRSNSLGSGRWTYFPQSKRYFHKKIAARPHAFQADREYLSNQRRRNLPVGESRQGPSGGPATELRENRQRNSRRTGNGTREAPRKLVASAWHEKALTANGTTEEFGKRGLRSKAPNDSEVTSSCDLGAEPDLRKIGE
jgi:hypothetical protein